jgi:hypothetical protein
VGVDDRELDDHVDHADQGGATSARRAASSAHARLDACATVSSLVEV